MYSATPSSARAAVSAGLPGGGLWGATTVKRCSMLSWTKARWRVPRGDSSARARGAGAGAAGAEEKPLRLRGRRSGDDAPRRLRSRLRSRLRPAIARRAAGRAVRGRGSGRDSRAALAALGPPFHELRLLPLHKRPRNAVRRILRIKQQLPELRHEGLGLLIQESCELHLQLLRVDARLSCLRGASHRPNGPKICASM